MACTLAASAALATPARSTRLSLRPAGLPAAARPLRPRGQRAAAVRASAQPPKTGSVLQDFMNGAERMLERYDFLSAGMGAMVITGFCVARGQDVGTALWITAAATVVAILVNDLIPEEF